MSNIQCDDIKCKDITADDIKINNKSIFDLIYPIGSIYISVTNLNPNTAFPGTTWTKLQGGYALVTTDNDSPSMSITSANNHIPGEAAQGGLPNITGNIEVVSYRGSGDGPFSQNYIANNNNSSYFDYDRSGGWGQASGINFDASRCSTNYGMYQDGVTSGNGRVIPDHISVVVWKRDS